MTTERPPSEPETVTMVRGTAWMAIRDSWRLGLMCWGVFSWLIMYSFFVVVQLHDHVTLSEPNPYILTFEILAFFLLAPVLIVVAWEYAKGLARRKDGDG